MSSRIGKCNNLEFCRTATLQRPVEIPDDEPFICPQCSADLQLISVRKKANTRAALLAVQAAAIVAGGGVIAWKLLLAPPSHDAPELHAPRASNAEMTLAANPDAPVDASAPAPAEPKAAQIVAGAPPQKPAKILLRLAGSDVVANHLARRLAAGYLALIGDTDIATVATDDPATVQIAGSEAGDREAVVIRTASSGGGLDALRSANADIALTSRPVSAAERAAMASLGDLTAATREHVIAIDAVAAVANPANPVPSITKAQLEDALAGRLTNWSALGQKPGPLRVYMHEADGTQADTIAAVLGDNVDVRAAVPLGSDAEVLEAVKRDPAAIGLVDWSNAAGARVLAVADDPARPVKPSDLSIANEDYPLIRRLYLYTASGDAASFSRRFADYAASSAGQAIVSATGFSSLSVRPAQTAASPSGGQAEAAEISEATAVPGSQRLSTTFHFQPGSFVLDTLGQRDIGRLVAYLKTQGLGGDHLLLAGFADNTGTATANQLVAQKRVQSVADALAHAGVTVSQTKSFGAAFPVADNQTEEGREKNRRVEAYMLP